MCKIEINTAMRMIFQDETLDHLISSVLSRSAERAFRKKYPKGKVVFFDDPNEPVFRVDHGDDNKKDLDIQKYAISTASEVVMEAVVDDAWTRYLVSDIELYMEYGERKDRIIMEELLVVPAKDQGYLVVVYASEGTFAPFFGEALKLAAEEVYKTKKEAIQAYRTKIQTELKEKRESLELAEAEVLQLEEDVERLVLFADCTQKEIDGICG